ncbi:MAG: hypothetical protein IPG00_15115 [Saprospiraceae bacterium]|nr:hypothetical protein [Saprospiraceae bacterium]
MIESDSDYLKVVELQKEKSNLERIVGKQQIRIDYYETLIEMIKEHYQDDIEKKFLKKVITRLHRNKTPYSMESVYRELGLSRQALHQQCRRDMGQQTHHKHLFEIVKRMENETSTNGESFVCITV